MNVVLIQTNYGFRRVVGIPFDYLPTGPFALHDAFDAFNGYGDYAHLRDFAQYSMSVGDIIGIDGEWHRCERMGWSDVSREEVMELMSAILDFRTPN